MGLRPIQQEDFAKDMACLDEGYNRLLNVAHCSYGKTHFMASLHGELTSRRKKKQGLILLHLDELVNQTVPKVQSCNPDISVEVEKAEHRADSSADVVVASVQSIGKHKKLDNGEFEFSPRLTKFNPDDFAYILSDECHHAARGTSYHAVYRHFGCLPSHEATFNPDQIHIGFTATPAPSGLSHIYEKIAFERNIRQGIELGSIVHPKCYRINTQIDLDHIKLGADGDLARKELEKTVNTKERNKIVVDNYIELGENFPFVGFTVDIQHSHDLAEAFNQRGISCVAISGKTPKEDRRKYLDLFREGKIKGIASCQVVTEGVDLPSATVGLMCRPTKSIVFFIQCVGRILRLHPSPEDLKVMFDKGIIPAWIKPYAIILDFCENSTKHQLCTAASLFGLRPDFDMKGAKAIDLIEKIEKIVSDKPGAIQAANFKDLASLTSFADSVDLFTKPTMPAELAGLSSYTWLGGIQGGYTISLPDYKTLTVRQDALGTWKVSQSVKGISSFLGENRDLKGAISLADKHIPSDVRAMLKADASWRTNAPTDLQIDLLWKRSKDFQRQFVKKDAFATFVHATMNRGDISNHINNVMGKR